MPKKTSTAANKIPFKALWRLLNYLHGEEGHYEDMLENGEDVSNHVFISIRTVTRWLREAEPAAWAAAEAAEEKYWAAQLEAKQEARSSA